MVYLLFQNRETWVQLLMEKINAYRIREYSSTLYVGMVRVVSFSLYIGIRAKIRNRLKIAEKKLCIVKNTPAML